MLTDFTMAFGRFTAKGLGRAVRFARGVRYRVQPNDAPEDSDGNRAGIIEDFEDATPPGFAYVRFDDTGKIEKVSLADLVRDKTQPA